MPCDKWNMIHATWQIQEDKCKVTNAMRWMQQQKQIQKDKCKKASTTGQIQGWKCNLINDKCNVTNLMWLKLMPQMQCDQVKRQVKHDKSKGTNERWKMQLNKYNVINVTWDGAGYH